VASYKVSENPTWSQPVVLNDGVLIKDEVALTLYSLK
jgi:hypothetical protein